MARFDSVTVRVALSAGLMVLLLASCGGGRMSLSGYATAVEDLTTTMNSRLDEIDVIFDRSEVSVDEVRQYAGDRMAARNAFLDGLEQLNPPEEAEPLHAAALNIIRALVAAEQEVADLAFATDDVATISGLWDSPTGQAARAVDAQVVELCVAAESALNSTRERQALAGMPWIPSELQEVVEVTFGCRAEDR